MYFIAKATRPCDTCAWCGEQIKDGDKVYRSINGEFVHGLACCKEVPTCT